MMMRKQQAPTESNAAAAIHALAAKVDGWRGQLRETLNGVIALEQAGVLAVNPSEAAYDVEQGARSRLNGAAYAAAATENKGIELFLKRREVAELKRAIELASQQSDAARIDLGRELLIKHDAEIRALHRERALVLLKLFKINGELEEMRLRLLRAGSSVPHPMDGWSLRLFGLSNPPSALNAWPMKYLAECVKADIITEKDLET
jgi:hypothetical protein